MGRDRDDAGQLEWVNAWAQSMTAHAAVEVAKPVSAAPAKTAEPAIIPQPVIAPVAHTLPESQLMRDIAEIERARDAPPMMAPVAHTVPESQLMRDIAEIERARDALAVVPVGGFFARQRTRALMLVPSRTADSVPIVVGGVMALVMLTVFGAAAAMTKLAR
jgi:hypothetical protein